MEVKVSKLNTASLRSKLAQVVSKALPLTVRQDILVKRLEPVKDLMVAKVPKHSGESAKEIGIEVLDGVSPGDARAAVGVGKDGYPLFFSEYGTENQPARPAVRPSWDSEADNVRSGIAADVQAAIGRSV